MLLFYNIRQIICSYGLIDVSSFSNTYCSEFENEHSEMEFYDENRWKYLYN